MEKRWVVDEQDIRRMARELRKLFNAMNVEISPALLRRLVINALEGTE